jgi:hypothetical protein
MPEFSGVCNLLSFWIDVVFGTVYTVSRALLIATVETREVLKFIMWAAFLTRFALNELRVFTLKTRHD